jgi:thymidylate synthase (FAD)
MFHPKQEIYTEFCPHNPGYVQLKQHMGQDIKTQVNAARASFGVEIDEVTDRDRKLFKFCARDGHTSTMEHNVFTFAFKVPLFVARQHMRHRTWSFNEISRRYTDKNLDFYTPIAFRQQSDSNRQASVLNSEINPVIQTIDGSLMGYTLNADQALETHVANSLKLYNSMIDSGVCREQARMVLPQNLYTYYWGTVNLNNFFKFYELRNHPGAQVEIQEMAIACMSLLEDVIPETIQIYKQAKHERDLNIIKTKLKTLNVNELDIVKNLLEN